jgi:hypothetical protein
MKRIERSRSRSQDGTLLKQTRTRDNISKSAKRETELKSIGTVITELVVK